MSSESWLVAEYLTEVRDLDRRIFPALDRIAEWLGGSTEIETIPSMRDTEDWSLGSFWAHPERVLDADARQATSGFARMDPAVVDRVVADITRDLADGTWEKRHGHLRGLSHYDIGLRLLVNQPSPSNVKIVTGAPSPPTAR